MAYRFLTDLGCFNLHTPDRVRTLLNIIVECPLANAHFCPHSGALTGSKFVTLL